MLLAENRNQRFIQLRGSSVDQRASGREDNLSRQGSWGEGANYVAIERELLNGLPFRPEHDRAIRDKAGGALVVVKESHGDRETVGAKLAKPTRPQFQPTTLRASNNKHRHPRRSTRSAVFSTRLIARPCVLYTVPFRRVYVHTLDRESHGDLSALLFFPSFFLSAASRFAAQARSV